MTATQDATIAELQRANAELRREREAGLAREATLAEELTARDAALAERNTEFGERIEHQAATIDVLKAMSASPGDAQPVFDLIVDRAKKLCDSRAALYQYDGTLVHFSAISNPAPTQDELAYIAMFPMPPTRSSIACRAILEGEIIHIRDMRADPNLSPAVRALDLGSNLAVPLIRDGKVIGTFNMNSKEAGGFSDGQIELLKTFAEQAVIAITSAETYRALQERTAALAARNSEYGERIEQQAATIEVLKAMSASAGDEQPVLDLVARRARELCDAETVGIFSFDSDMISVRCVDALDPQSLEAYLKTFPRAPARDYSIGRAILDRRTIEIDDADADPNLAAVVHGHRNRSIITLPLVVDDRVAGGMSIGVRKQGGLTDPQKALARTLAEQVSIAISAAETYRALQTRTSDLQESLEYQTAISDVLKVIGRSTFDLHPVFETIVITAGRLCGSNHANITIREGDGYRWVAGFSDLPGEAARGRFFPVDRESITGRTVLAKQVVHVADVIADPDFLLTEGVRRAGVRTVLGVPMMRDGVVVGTLNLGRDLVRPFSERQIELVRTFADQAVIAMENARLLGELRQRTGDLQESLEYQTATSDVLKVISRATFDLQPVLDTVVETAARLCDADQAAIARRDGEMWRFAANCGFPPEYEAYYRARGAASYESDSPSVAARTAIEGRPVHIQDVAAVPGYPETAVRLGKQRTSLGVPLLREGVPIGVLLLARQRVEPFTDRQIDLVSTFADQAVIAIENTRLITEQREALEQQTATAEVLQVINASPGNLIPVFDAILEKAMRLCGVAFGILDVWDGQNVREVATRGLPAALADWYAANPVRRPGPLGARLLRTKRSQQLSDVREGEGYRDGHPGPRALADLGGARTGLVVPLLKDDGVPGYFIFFRQEVRPYFDKEIALLENFAAQAVIAIENTRLITEQREALEQQTATAEVLQVINASPGVLAPVFDAILEKAHSLCGVALGELELYEDGKFRAVAMRGVSGPLAELLRQPFTPPPNSPLARLLAGEPVVQFADLFELAQQRPDDRRAQAGAQYGLRTVLFVPLRKDDALLGYITAYRQEVRPFSEREIALLQNFAAQAVIAMENTRLITEISEALEQQTATAEVLQVINASPGDLAPVFEAMLEKAMRLCEAQFGVLSTYDGERFRIVAAHGIPVAYIYTQGGPEGVVPPTGSALERVANGDRVVHILDLVDTDAYRQGVAWRLSLVETTGARTALWVALRKDDALLGVFVIYRQEVRAFTGKQIALLKNFAAQAVIAMENARLLTETREALEQQTATAEVLEVINSSPGDLGPVFQALLRKAHTLCEASFGALMTYDGERFHAVAHQGTPAPFREFLGSGLLPGPGDPFGLMVEGAAYSHIHDLLEVVARYPGEPLPRAAADLGGIRTLLVVPLRKDSELLGVITAYRQETRPFSDRQIALLQNFAAQAVIAMENARLLTEQQEALEQQTATAEVLQVINASPGNLTPVFDAMLEKAIRLCEAEFGTLRTWDGERFHLGAAHGDPELIEWTKRQRPFTPINGNFPLGRIVRGAEIVRITDAPSSGFGAIAAAIAFRSGIAVALRKDATLLGAITVYRKNEVQPFTDRQIALLQSFAAQAVIAMENARLLDEIRQRQEELRVTFENMGDGVAMFDETQYLAAWNRKFQDILDLPDALLEQRRTYEEHLRFLAARGDFGPGVDTVEQIEELVASTGQPYGYERTRPDGRVIEIRRNPVPDGGFVLIYSDITERKRSEEEIRAARDAAETALRELRTAQANLIQAEKMASLGQLTAGIAHEIKNPLNFVNNFSALSTELIDELRDVLVPEPLGETARTEVDDLTALLKGNLEKVVQHGQRADGIVRSMLDHSRGSSGERRMVDLNALIDEALNLAYHGARAQDQSFNITLERDFGEGIAPIEVNPQDITRVFLNLFSNGFYATTKRARDGGDAEFVPTLKITTCDAGDAVEIRVRDNGTGIPADITDKLFQPFFTTKPTGEGTGLGLSITYDIVTQQHGGSIAVDSKVGQFTEFTIRLPRNP